MGGVGLEDVSVAGFQFFEYAGLIDNTGAAVVGECAEKNSYPNFIIIPTKEVYIL